MTKRLGRGLGSLLKEPEPRESRTEIELDRIRPNPFQPRRTFPAAGLEELRNSIRNHGVLQPIVVRPAADGYELVSGERRCRAARLASLERIPAIVRDDVDDEAMLELALVENVQRQDLGPIEKAVGYKALQERLGLTQDAVAARVGLQRSTVANHLRLLELPAAVQQALAEGLVSMGHARALLGLADEKERLELMEEAVRDQLSVRQVEARVREASAPKGAKGSATRPGSAGDPTAAKRLPWVNELEDRLRLALGTKVELTSNEACHGRLVVEFYDREMLESLVDRLAPKAEL